ncbi:NADH:ubiquinone oxidoreductase subunit 6 (chain J) [Streptomyces sp. MnatMP-M77]|uniref:NADH-quinone oxidoreductase subunit J n=1 Tax=Streptomyces TaxID=1883 RepID=UPI000805DEB0|nr:NADH-quinone oxidoreductase subunit J [Streptomyces sp. MnatMP-M77]MYT78041.1 NADH:ubiquinone oxidoreductase subunit J [Streptomyces sp. SID8364]SBU91716.1 NADH:ubiquinone oxidoreductase subunit 6 (chain J) [Streptomyces sp. MnatMP-M77]
MTLAVLLALGVLAVGGGVLVFVVDSMARATFCLLASFIAVAVMILMTGLAYLGTVIILMMIIEMVIMAVFMIMYMMNPAGLMPMSMFHNIRGAALISGLLFAGLTAGIFLTDWPEKRGERPKDPTTALGETLMEGHMLTMMTLGVTLFSTIVATVVLATGRGRYDRLGDGLDAAHADDPAGGGVGR